MELMSAAIPPWLVNTIPKHRGSALDPFNPLGLLHSNRHGQVQARVRETERTARLR